MTGPVIAPAYAPLRPRLREQEVSGGEPKGLGQSIAGGVGGRASAGLNAGDVCLIDAGLSSQDILSQAEPASSDAQRHSHMSRD